MIRTAVCDQAVGDALGGAVGPRQDADDDVALADGRLDVVVREHVDAAVPPPHLLGIDVEQRPRC